MVSPLSYILAAQRSDSGSSWVTGSTSRRLGTISPPKWGLFWKHCCLKKSGTMWWPWNDLACSLQWQISYRFVSCLVSFVLCFWAEGGGSKSILYTSFSANIRCKRDDGDINAGSTKTWRFSWTLQWTVEVFCYEARRPPKHCVHHFL